MRIHRRVDVIVQNHTQELLTIEGAMAIEGAWGLPGPPKIGGIIARQGSGKWVGVSTEEGIAAAGFLRFGCTKGYIHLKWSLPRSASDFDFSVETPDALTHHVERGGPNLDLRVVLVTLAPRRPPEA